MSASTGLGTGGAATMARVAAHVAVHTGGEGFEDQSKRPASPGAHENCGSAAVMRRADHNAEPVQGRLHADPAQTARPITHSDPAGRLARIAAMDPIAAIRAARARIVDCVTG